MLTSLLDHLLIHAIDGSRHLLSRVARRARPQTSPSDHAVIGHTIPTQPNQTRQTVSISPEEWLRHQYVLGATGTGKTNLLLRLIESDIENERSFCVIDLRGDLVDRVLLRLATSDGESLRKRLVLIDLRQSDHVVGFNPLVGHGDVYSRALHLLQVVHMQSESWGVQLEETMRNAFVALAESGWSLLELDPLLGNPEFRASVLTKVTDPYVRSFFEKYGSLSEDKKTAWTLPVVNKITPLLSIPVLRLMFGQRQSISFSRLLDEQPGKIVLVSLGVDRLHQAAYLVGALFVSAVQSAIMSRTDTPEKDRRPVHLYIDEFETMATDRFEAIVAEGRRFRLGLCPSHQNSSQLPSRLREVIRNNVHTQFYFQTGALDATDLANELSTSEPKEAVRAALISQAVGEAYLVRRGQPSVRVKVAHCPDPDVTPESFAHVRNIALSSHSRPVVEIERELAQREASRKSPNAIPSKSAGPVKPTYEIRHGKTPGQFKPKNA